MPGIPFQNNMVEHSRSQAVQFFKKYCREHASELKDKEVYDLSAGSGFIIHLFHEAGATIHPFDMHPAQNNQATVPSQHIDLQKDFPIASGLADVVVCAETIEHLPNQLFFFQEVTRILKPGGILLLTTPNHSSLRGRLSYFLMESEHYSVPPPNKVTFKVKFDSGNEYVNRVFLIGIQRLQTLASVNHLSIFKIHKSKGSFLSWLLLLTYPLIWCRHWITYRKASGKNPESKIAFHESFKLNTSLDVC
ncbi:MAG: class I SAM-dependent methyltransferase [Flammeovirgaceae bacterium]|nr:class I SAM-dependent methyltransferase [Flammeovirgaceae bacterium]